MLDIAICDIQTTAVELDVHTLVVGQTHLVLLFLATGQLDQS